MMEELFLALWNRSIAALWLILAAAALRLVLKGAPKSLRCLLWALVGVRLACPFSIESALSLVPSAQTVPQAVMERDAFYVSSGLAVVNSVVNEGLVDFYETAGLPAGHARGVLFACGAVWLAGAAAMCLWALASWLGLRRRVAAAAPEGGGVWLCGQIGSPFLMGLFRPRIYLPQGLDGEERACVLAHERAHIRRRDHWAKPAGFLLLAVYWFNPLVWLAYILFCRDVELACDEAVIRELGPESKKPYSLALLRCNVRRGPLAACPLAFGEVGVKERVENILRYKKPALWVVLVSLLLCAVAAVCFLTDPKADPVPAEDPAPAPEEGLATAPVRSRAAGQLLYQMAVLDYLPLDGSAYASVTESGDRLTILDGAGEEVFSGTLDGTGTYDREAFLELFDSYAQADGLDRMVPMEVTEAAERFYRQDDRDETGMAVWELSLEGGETWLWLSEGAPPVRLYELIDPEEAFPYLRPGVMDAGFGGYLWTRNPGYGLPVRFEGEFDHAAVYARSDTLWGEDRDLTRHLDLDPGGTARWDPGAEDGPPETAVLHFYFYLEDGTVLEDYLELRTVSKAQGLYGSRTYGAAIDWMGFFSSKLHEVRLSSDGSALVLSPLRGR